MDTTPLKKYIGKQCEILTVGGNGVYGTVRDVTESFMEVEDKKGRLTTVNCEYLNTIQEK